MYVDIMSLWFNVLVAKYRIEGGPIRRGGVGCLLCGEKTCAIFSKLRMVMAMVDFRMGWVVK